MSTLAFFTESTFTTGDLVCVDTNTGYAVPYDEKDPLPVVGVALKPDTGYTPNGRQWGNINGPPYYENDTYIWQNDTTSNLDSNPDYVPFNPLSDAGYITCVINGLAAVKASISEGIPASWILLQPRTGYNWYCIR